MGRYYVRWSLFVKVVTVIVTLVLIVVNVRLISHFDPEKPAQYLVLLCVLLLPLSVIIVTPIYVELTDKYIIVKRLIGKAVYAYDSIALAEEFTLNNSDIRIFGSGSFFGYIGIFSNRMLGKYQCAVCNPKEAFMIILKDGRKRAFSCRDKELVVESIKRRI